MGSQEPAPYAQKVGGTSPSAKLQFLGTFPGDEAPQQDTVNGDTAGGPANTYDIRRGPASFEEPLKPNRGLDMERALDDMKRNILTGNLRVFVFNKSFELQAKRLAMNPNSRRISILRDDGLCEDSWEIESLRCVTQGIDATVLSEPAPPGGASFRFKFQESDTEDRFLCVVFETLEHMFLATEAFGQLCEVPVNTA